MASGAFFLLGGSLRNFFLFFLPNLKHYQHKKGIAFFFSWPLFSPLLGRVTPGRTDDGSNLDEFRAFSLLPTKTVSGGKPAKFPHFQPCRVTISLSSAAGLAEQFSLHELTHQNSSFSSLPSLFPFFCQVSTHIRTPAHSRTPLTHSVRLSSTNTAAAGDNTS